MQPAIQHQMDELAVASNTATNSISKIDTVKCFNGQGYELDKYKQAIMRAASYYLVQAKLNAIQIGFIRLLMLGMFVQGFWYGNHLVEAGKKSAGEVLTGFWACLMATQTFEQILPQFIVLEKGRTAATILSAVLQKIERRPAVPELLGGMAPTYCEGDIQVTNVWQ